MKENNIDKSIFDAKEESEEDIFNKNRLRVLNKLKNLPDNYDYVHDALLNIVKPMKVESSKDLPTIEKIIDIMLSKPKTEKYQVVNKNILIIGRSRTGKTTLANMLGSSLHICPDMNLFSGTRSNTTRELVALDNKKKILYNLTVLDTPGLFDRTKIGEGKLSNDTILEDIEYDNALFNTDIVLFTIRFSDGLNSQDIESFNLYMNLLTKRNLSDKCYIVFTGAEMYTSKNMKHIIKEACSLAPFENFKDRILFSGSPKVEDIENRLFKSFKKSFQNTIKLKNKILNILN
jgi:GTPase Era involved in 16S rRNA processing